MKLSSDAIIFGLAYLSTPKATLSFGGDGAKMRITDRARAALDELLASGLCEPCDPTDSVPNREYYRGKVNMFVEAKDAGMNPFETDHWPCFVKGGDA